MPFPKKQFTLWHYSKNERRVSSKTLHRRRLIHLQVIAKHDEYRFNYSLDGTNFQNLGDSVSGDILSTNVAGGFTGALIGLHATSGNTTLPE